MTSKRQFIARTIDAIIDREGGLVFTNRKSDRGGPTKAGITLATLTAWRLRHGRPPATAEDVQALEASEIREIYRDRYIFAPRFDLIEDPQLFEHAVDCGVLHGPPWTIRTLQRLVRVKVDGIIGPITSAAIQAEKSDRLNLLLAVERIQFMAAIVANDAKRRGEYEGQIENLRGWLNRATHFIQDEAND